LIELVYLIDKIDEEGHEKCFYEERGIKKGPSLVYSWIRQI
jgi:hypothetical protein